MQSIPQDVLDEAGLTLHEAQGIVTPTAIGPTWQRDADGAWVLPEHTLGWEIAGWCAEYLRSPNGGRWKFTNEQLRFVLWWYAVDESGDWVYRSGVLQRCKGWGKDPLLAVLALVEFVGPCRFSHWKNGQPVAKPEENPWVSLMAVSAEQNKNTLRALPGLITEKLKKDYGIKPGIELWRALGGRAHLESVTSNYRSAEGNRTTFTVLNETHHWVSGNGGHDMYLTAHGNTTKIAGSRQLAITNAFLPGEDSVAERMRQTYEWVKEGRAQDARFLYDSLEAAPGAPLKGPLVPYVLRGVQGDAHWLPIEATVDAINLSHISPQRSRRMYYNQIVASEEALHGPETWDPLEVKGATLERGDEVALGFDGGKSDDATALIAIRISDMCAFKLGVWEAPPGVKEWEVDRRAVDSAVHMAFSTYDVVAFFADVFLWESYIDSWADTYGEGLLVKSATKNPIAWDMRGGGDKVTRAHERLMQTIFDGMLKHDGDQTLRRHVLNAQRRDNKYGVSFDKESRDSPRKVDAYAALMLAHEAAVQYRIVGKERKVRTGMGYFL